MPERMEEDMILDLLDSGIGKKLDNLRMKDMLRETALKSAIPVEKKVELLEFLSAEKSVERISLLAIMVFDYFKNAKEVLEKSAGEISVDDVRTVIMAELEPSIMEYDEEQVNILIYAYYEGVCGTLWRRLSDMEGVCLICGRE